MASDSELRRRLDALNEAIASGVLTTSYSTPEGGTQSVTYKSTADMLKARGDLERQLGMVSATRRKAGRLRWGV